MTYPAITRRVAAFGAAAVIGLGGHAFAAGHQVVDSIHFLIPGGAGGGWDGTARGTGEALTGAELRDLLVFARLFIDSLRSSSFRSSCHQSGTPRLPLAACLMLSMK